MKDIIYIIIIVIIFFIFGIILSKIIDYLFPDHNPEKHDYYILIEIICELGIAYIIYFLLKKYIETIINSFYIKLSKKTPTYLAQILLFSFSMGIFKHLQKSTDKINHCKNKIFKVGNLGSLTTLPK